MTEFSGALNNSNFDGKTILFGYADSKYVCISGLEIFEFRTGDEILDYISLMGNNMIPYTFAVGKNTHISYQLNTNLLKTIKSRKVCY